jgi:hypothetical protein
MSGPTKKSEFRNTRDHQIGVVLKREDGKMKGMAIAPGDSVWMDEEEQMATANAPRKESDNPFVNGDLELVQSARALANRRPIGDTEHPQQEVGGQVADGAPATEEPEAAGADSDGEEGSAQEESSEEPQAPAEEPEAPVSGKPTREQAEASARAAAGRRRAPAPNEHTGSSPKPAGDPPEGQRAPAEEVGTPEAVAQE